jgi:hypothetical protein
MDTRVRRRDLPVVGEIDKAVSEVGVEGVAEAPVLP